MFEHIILDNGLNIYLIQDNNKHVSLANLIINFGGYDDLCLINDKKKCIKSGTAHFLEHLVLENSEYGDLMSIFSSRGVRSNGLTTIERTEFYIDTVDNFYDNLSIMIKGIHSPIFSKNRVDEIRKPILEEKRRSLDNKFSNLYNTILSTYLDNSNFKSILGDLKDIESITNMDLKEAFESFYRPSNEILVISGNFNRSKVLDVIKDSYKSIKFSGTNFVRYKYKETDRVNKKRKIVKDNTNIQRTVISYKINIKDYGSYERLMLDTYIYTFLRMNFGVTSKLNADLVSNNIILGNINFNTSVVNNYYIIRIEANTKDSKKFEKIIIDYIKNRDYIFDESLFDLYKKGYIIDVIVRNDNIYNTLEAFIQNVIFFKYENVDKVEDIEDMSFNTLIDMINKLDFSNYSITMLKY